MKPPRPVPRPGTRRASRRHAATRRRTHSVIATSRLRQVVAPGARSGRPSPFVWRTAHRPGGSTGGSGGGSGQGTRGGGGGGHGDGMYALGCWGCPGACTPAGGRMMMGGVGSCIGGPIGPGRGSLLGSREARTRIVAKTNANGAMMMRAQSANRTSTLTRAQPPGNGTRERACSDRSPTECARNRACAAFAGGVEGRLSGIAFGSCCPCCPFVLRIGDDARKRISACPTADLASFLAYALRMLTNRRANGFSPQAKGLSIGRPHSPYE